MSRQPTTSTTISPAFPTTASAADGEVEGGGQIGDEGIEGEELQAADVEDIAKADGAVAEESVLRRALPSPYMPTISEIRHHKTTHLPYRSWCDECVEAFAREWPHLRGDGPSNRTIAVIWFDYAHLAEKGLCQAADSTEDERKD